MSLRIGKKIGKVAASPKELFHDINELAQLAQLEGGFLFFCLPGLKKIKGLTGDYGANRRVVPTIAIFF